MNPAGKAKRLIEDFENLDHCGIKHFPHQGYCDCVGPMNRHLAKRAAIKLCEEILSLPFEVNCDAGERLISPVMDFWEKVKRELEFYT